MSIGVPFSVYNVSKGYPFDVRFDMRLGHHEPNGPSDFAPMGLFHAAGARRRFPGADRSGNTEASGSGDEKQRVEGERFPSSTVSREAGRQLYKNPKGKFLLKLSKMKASNVTFTKRSMFLQGASALDRSILGISGGSLPL